jgi:hypothetical protein
MLSVLVVIAAPLYSIPYAGKSFNLSVLFATVLVTVGFTIITCPTFSSVISGMLTVFSTVAAAVSDVP